MSHSPVSFLELPNEVLYKVFLMSTQNTNSGKQQSFVLSSRDLLNASLLSDNIRQLIFKERSCFLFDEVFDTIKAQVSEKEIFKWRGVCKRWKETLDAFLKIHRFIGTNQRFNPYQVLELNIRSTFREVRHAALHKIRRTHPDKGGTHPEAVNIILAEKILSNPIYRVCFENCHESPIHLKLAWENYERLVKEYDTSDEDQ